MPKVAELMSSNIANTITNVQTWGGIIYNVKEYGAKGDGTTDDTAAIQAALDAAEAAGGGVVYAPPGIYLIDRTIKVPANTILIGAGLSTIFKVIGHDTHGRNSALAEQFLDQIQINNPVVITLEGSNSEVRNLVVDGNGLQNYLIENGNVKYLDESRRFGICGVRLGKLLPRNPGDPMVVIHNVRAENLVIKNCSWGAIQINGQYQNLYSDGSEVPEDDLFGAVECVISDCRIEYTNSNVVATFGVVNCKIKDNVIISPFHSGIKAYVRTRGLEVKNNTIIMDDSRQHVWYPTLNSVVACREKELETRSDAICVGHSDYDTEISDVSIISNEIIGNGGTANGVKVYGKASNILIEDNAIKDVFFGVIFTFPESVVIKGNTIKTVPYTTTEYSPGSEYTGSDVRMYSTSSETNKVPVSNFSKIKLVGNILMGTGVSNLRISNMTVLNSKGITLMFDVEDNRFYTGDLDDYGGTTKSIVGLFATPTLGGIKMSGNTYTEGSNDNSFEDIFPSGIPSYLIMLDNFRGSFTPAAEGLTSAGVGTYTKQVGYYIIQHGMVYVYIDLAWTNHTGTGSMKITGLPVSSKADGPACVFSVSSTALTFSGQLVAQMGGNSVDIRLLGISSGAGLSDVEIDPSVSALRITGSYPI